MSVESKFKSGDSVKVTSDQGMHYRKSYYSEVGVVQESDSLYPYVKFKDGTIWSFPQRCLELAEEEKSQWISVKDRLPKKSGNYLCFLKNDKPKLDNKIHPIFWTNKWCQFSDFMWIANFTITHWMPLPEPPKE